jgi:predicted Zn-dependent peptidase
MISTDSSTSSRIKKYKGANGITVLQQDNLSSRIFCMGVWINTGSRDEAAGEEGICHFFEHMVFKGTKTRSAFEISQAIEKVGGSLDAFTTKEHICIYAQVLNDHKDLAIDVISDMLSNSTFPPDQVALERQVVLEEIDDVEDAPDDFIHDLFASVIFPNHPLGKPILGVPSTVSGFTRDHLIRFAKRTLKAGNITVSIMGNVDKRTLRKICHNAFALPDGTYRRSKRRIGSFRPVRRLYKRKLNHQHLCIGGRACSYLDDKRFPYMVLATLLGGGMSSRLFQRIREELGFAYSIFTFADYARDAGYIGTYLAVKPSNTRAALREIFKEFGKIKDGMITKQELEDTKEHIKGRILLGLETSAAKMIRFTRNEIYYGRQIGERELIDRIDRITMDDILEISADAMNVEKTALVSMGPSSSGIKTGRK